MQQRLNEVIEKLGVAEKEIVEKKFYSKLIIWTRLVDEVEAGLTYIDDLSNKTQSFESIKSNLGNLVDQVAALSIGDDPSGVTTIQQSYSAFAQRDYEHLLDLKLLLRAATEDLTDIQSLKKINAEAVKRKTELEKAFSDYTSKQSENSTRTLAKYFDIRLKDLKSNNNKLTSVNSWNKNRGFWLKCLAAAVAVFILTAIILIKNDQFKGNEIQIVSIKLTVIAILYSQYHFATKNFHIYADLVARYEHLSVIAKTMTDFSAAAYEDDILRESVLSNASKTLFSDVTTGHQKNAEKESSVFENIINQTPKGKE
jgi:hypothetical protein